MKKDENIKIALCSNSATRAKLLDDFGVDYEILGLDYDENLASGDTPRAKIYNITMGKLARAKELHADKRLPLLVADTMVVCVSGDQEIALGKPKDKNHARQMLGLQSGGVFKIITCAALFKQDRTVVDISATSYEFALFDKQDLERYLASGEYKNKAGACEVEGFCKPYILSQKGQQSTAMGLHVQRLLPHLKKHNNV